MVMNNRILTAIGCCLITTMSYGQTKIKDGTITSFNLPNTNAILELESNNKGLLLPRLTQIQRDAITSVPEGLLIYNTTDSCINQFNRGVWNSLCQSSDFCQLVLVNDDADTTFLFTNPNNSGGIFSPELE
jgi:hypothetical protein